MMPDPLAVLLFLLFVVVLWLWERDRRAWTAERAALLERCVPGLRLEPTPPVKREPLSSDPDEREWQIEQRRAKKNG